MRVPHFLVLVGGFVREEVERVLRRRGVSLKSFDSNENGSHNVVVSFDPKRISAKRIVEVLTNHEDKQAAIIPMADWEKNHDKTPRGLVPAE